MISQKYPHHDHSSSPKVKLKLCALPANNKHNPALYVCINLQNTLFKNMWECLLQKLLISVLVTVDHQRAARSNQWMHNTAINQEYFQSDLCTAINGIVSLYKLTIAYICMKGHYSSKGCSGCNIKCQQWLYHSHIGLSNCFSDFNGVFGVNNYSRYHFQVGWYIHLYKYMYEWQFYSKSSPFANTDKIEKDNQCYICILRLTHYVAMKWWCLLSSVYLCIGLHL